MPHPHDLIELVIDLSARSSKPAGYGFHLKVEATVVHYFDMLEKDLRAATTTSPSIDAASRASSTAAPMAPSSASTRTSAPS